MTKAMRFHAESGARWERDFGDRPVVSYEFHDYGRVISPTAKQYRKDNGL